MSYDFRDKVIAVTGGIGSAMCHRFAAGGAQCVVVDIDEARAKKAAAELPGGGHLGVSCDLVDWAQIEQLFERIGEEYGRLDVLVNTVGMTSTERFDERSVASIEQEITELVADRDEVAQDDRCDRRRRAAAGRASGGRRRFGGHRV